MIVAGDFNAHHTMWGCGSIDSHARDIDVMEENNLVLLNDRNPTTKGSNRWRPNGLDLWSHHPWSFLANGRSVNDLLAIIIFPLML